MVIPYYPFAGNTVAKMELDSGYLLATDRCLSGRYLLLMECAGRTH